MDDEKKDDTPRVHPSRKEMEGRIWKIMDAQYRNEHDGVGYLDDPTSWMRCATCVSFFPDGYECSNKEEYVDFVYGDCAYRYEVDGNAFPYSISMCLMSGGWAHGTCDAGIERGCWRPAAWLPNELLEPIMKWLEENINFTTGE